MLNKKEAFRFTQFASRQSSIPTFSHANRKRRFSGHKKILSIMAALALLPSSALANVNYTVQKGDSYWLIAKKFNTSLNSVLESNNATQSSQLEIGQTVTVNSDTYVAQKGDTYYLIAKKCGIKLSDLLNINGVKEGAVLNVGDFVKLKASSNDIHIVKKGDTYWTISKQYGVSLSELLAINGAKDGDVLNVGDSVKIPSSTVSGAPYITYTTYTVKRNDTLWSIAIDSKIPFKELLETNSLTENSYIYEGMKLTIPVHHIPVKKTPSEKYGELLDWFTEAQYVVPINADFILTDLESGKSFNARRTVGSGHADCEPLTAKDTQIMKEIWGGYFNWNKRSVLITYNGRKIAASASGMLHAGNENAPGGAWTDWRSDNYGAGQNYDYVKGNNANGHFDLYFYNSIGHSSGTTNATHQANVKKSAGM